ncbi:MAG: hypothetical protein KKC39_01115 [Candidatus Omnitrophica bacterium]|nr:hypothetical protein [Candidatus Omnitrophota bacterium]MCG2707130.1 hypothetical protein [Candidatus Omnitrophota bacterium]
MNYLIFDEDIYYDLDGKTGIVSKGKMYDVFGGLPKDAAVAVIDTLQKQVAAPEKSSSKKDEVIASSFSGEYLTQSERIAENLFQVIAIEKPKVAQVYKHLGFENVRLVVPYGVALREFLRNNNLFSQDKRIVFLDYLGDQVLLTIFNKEAFTTPRRLSKVLKQVTRELMRSQENYRSQNKVDAEISFLIVTNSKEIIDEIVVSGLELKENIIYFPDPYPVLSGLKQGKFSMHYLLPEQFIRLRKLKETKRRVFNLGVMLGILAFFLILLLGSLSVNKTASMRLKNLQLEEDSQDEALKSAYLAKYKDILRHEKKINFPYFFSLFLEALPSEYRLESVTIRGLSSGRYRFEAIVSLWAKDKPFTKMSLPVAFKQAKVENILVKDNPGLKVTLDIF